MSTVHDKSIRAVRIVRDVPLEDYRNDSDGRQWKHQAKERQRLMMLLATYADPDGSNIKVSVDELASRLGCARRTIFNLLDDFEKMELIINDNKLSSYHGTRIRAINPDWLKLQLKISEYKNWRVRKALVGAKWVWDEK